jgi:hypothetical protein
MQYAHKCVSVSGPALHLIARLYAVEERAEALSLSAEERLAVRQRVSVSKY